MPQTVITHFSVTPAGTVVDLRTDPDLGRADADWIEDDDEVEDEPESFVAVILEPEPSGRIFVIGPYPTRPAALAVVERDRQRGVITEHDTVHITRLRAA